MKEDGGDPSPAMPSSDSPTQPKRILDSPSESPKPQKLLRSVEEGCGGGSEGMSQNPRVQRYLVAVEYIGTRFSGSQRQPNCRTVVGVLEDAFHKFIGQPVSISCSSRTDAGVHALSNVCHVDVERISKRKPGEVLTPHEPGVVRRAVNHFLQLLKSPCDRYHYRILSGPELLSTFEKDRAWHVPEELDILAMKKACSILIGSHDFSSFRATGCQVRLMVGVLKSVGTGELTVSDVERILNAKSVTAASPMAPACGLYLGNVKYDIP
ncbi:tRNA pseudouridine synthase [Musa troglodytarum]|uniref:tRNA pseudouridine synthase n=1 Tax=Musa troglodytarum TaxID=320322 RepID=A0A9E7H5F8_9LILI|nr:tRNA pseudouridine synthase [Musa troglodytarum]